MARIQPVQRETADMRTAKLLDGVEKKLGGVPNLITTLAQSPAAVQAYLGFSQALAAGRLPARLREQLALAVAEANACEYCVAAHTAIGKGAGLTEEETIEARQGEAKDARERAALEFARTVVRQRGQIADTDLQAVRQAGYTDGDVTEIVAHVALNLFTNYFNNVAETEVDFPAVRELAAA